MSKKYEFLMRIIHFIYFAYFIILPRVYTSFKLLATTNRPFSFSSYFVCDCYWYINVIILCVVQFICTMKSTYIFILDLHHNVHLSTDKF